MSDSFVTEMDVLVRAKFSTIYVVTWEEQRAISLLSEVARRQEKELHQWNITDGLRRVYSPRNDSQPSPKDRHRDVMAMLNEILQSNEPGIYALLDLDEFLDSREVVRQIRDLHHALKATRKSLVIISPQFKVSEKLAKTLTVVDLPLPTYTELRQLLVERVIGRSENRAYQVQLSDSDIDALAREAQGLTLAEASCAFAKAIVRDNKLCSSDVAAVFEQKRQIIRKSGLLEYYDTRERLDNVGGMPLLKDWLLKRKAAFTQAAREYGLPAPRGMMLLGVQGCGKSMIAKSIATEWQYPLLRMDMSRIFSAYIGSSEDNMRQALKLAEGLAPVVLWVDEIEKALSGMDASSASDGGTTARVIGQFLTWMQEKTAPVFVVATANTVEKLPPELIRKGRLDEVFFVDLPNAQERSEIFRIHLRRRHRDPAQFEVSRLVDASNGFSGAEIEQSIVSAMHDSFSEDRQLAAQDILKSLQVQVPLSQTMRERIDSLRAWAAQRARPVTQAIAISQAS